MILLEKSNFQFPHLQHITFSNALQVREWKIALFQQNHITHFLSGAK